MKRKQYKYVQEICARCGNEWKPNCCEYSYKAIERALDNPKLNIKQANILYRLLKKL